MTLPARCRLKQHPAEWIINTSQKVTNWQPSMLRRLSNYTRCFRENQFMRTPFPHLLSCNVYERIACNILGNFNSVINWLTFPNVWRIWIEPRFEDFINTAFMYYDKEDTSLSISTGANKGDTNYQLTDYVGLCPNLEVNMSCVS